MDLFESITRPRAEMKVIDSFIFTFNKAKKIYKLQNYSQALPEFQLSYDILTPIFDILPKVEVLFYLMKTQFTLEMYDECLETKQQLHEYLLQIQTEKERYLNIYSKMFLYEIVIAFIQNRLNDSMTHTLDFIAYVKDDKTLPDVEDKSYLFMRVLKGLLRLGKIVQTKQYALFIDHYNTMIVEIENEDGDKVQMVKSKMKELYKSFMSTKIRKFIFDELNAMFYKLKYGLGIDNKVVSFLDKKMHIYVRENNYQKLIEMFETFIHLNKIDLSVFFGNMNKYNVVHEQKNRIVAFDTIFGNFCGAFGVIFDKYLTDSYIDPLLKDSFASMGIIHDDSQLSVKRTFSSSLNFKSNLAEQAHVIFEQIKQRAKLMSSSNNNTNNTSTFNSRLNSSNCLRMSSPYSTIKRKSTLYRCKDFDFAKDVVIPPNIENSKENVHYDKLKATGKKLTKRFMTTSMGFKKKGLHLPSITTTEFNKNQTNNILSIGGGTTTTPITTVNTQKDTLNSLLFANNNLTTSFTETSTSQNNNNNGNAMVTNNQQQQQRSMKNNNVLMSIVNKQMQYPLRNINNYHLRVRNYIKSYSSCSEKGNPNGENQDSVFNIEHFLLIKNLHVFGVCDGHGKNGKSVSDAICQLFPAYMHYLAMDNDLIRKGEDINNLIISLFKVQEHPEVRDMNIIRYFFNKCEIIYKYIPFIRKNTHELLYDISEAFFRTHSDLKDRLKLEIEFSGSTVCTLFIHGLNLYCANIGDSRALMCSYIFDKNKWECNQLTVDHKPHLPSEMKRINVLNGKVERAKDERGDPFGPPRVWFKNSNTNSNVDDNGPGLAMSRSIGDSSAKKIGVSCEPELFQYKLKHENKFIVIGTDGLWDNLSNEEVLAIAGDCYDLKEKAEFTAATLVNKARTVALERNERKERKSTHTGYHHSSKGSNALNIIDDVSCWVIYLDIKQKE